MNVAPGMTIPSDLELLVAIRSLRPVERVQAEYPDQTLVEQQPDRNGRQCFRVQSRRLGENLLTLHHGDGATTRLEFFAPEPLETLIHKRAAFIANHQHRDALQVVQRPVCGVEHGFRGDAGPEQLRPDPGLARIYEVTCDDPGLSKPAFLASKNAEYSSQPELEALDDYIQHFVWGGLQRTTEETYSYGIYGIYGILNWKRNRDSSDPGSKGKLHLWRPYDYSHLVVMYFAMYRVGRDFPAVHLRMDTGVHLERAYGTALAMFTVPMSNRRLVGLRDGLL